MVPPACHQLAFFLSFFRPQVPWLRMLSPAAPSTLRHMLHPGHGMTPLTHEDWDGRKLWRITVQDPNTLGLKQQELKPKRWVSVQRTQICPKPLGFPPSIRGYNGDHWIPNSSFPFLLASAPRLTCRMQAMPGADGASSCKSTTPFRWTWKLQQRRRLPGQRWNDVLGVAGWILHRRYAHLCKIVVGSWGSCLPNDGILMTNKWKGRFRGSTADPKGLYPMCSSWITRPPVAFYIRKTTPSQRPRYGDVSPQGPMCLWQRRLSYTANHCKKEIRTWSEVGGLGHSLHRTANIDGMCLNWSEVLNHSEPIHPNVPPNKFWAPGKPSPCSTWGCFCQYCNG